MNCTVTLHIHDAYKGLDLPSPDHIPAEPGECIGDNAGRLAFVRGAIVTAAKQPNGERGYWFDPLLLIEGRHFVYSPEHSKRFDPPFQGPRYWVEIQTKPA